MAPLSSVMASMLAGLVASTAFWWLVMKRGRAASPVAPRIDNGWTVIAPNPSVRRIYAAAGAACGLGFGALAIWMTHDRSFGRLTDQTFYACLAVFLGFACLGLYICATAWRSSVRFNDEGLRVGAFLHRHVPWHEVRGFHDDPSWGPLVVLKSGKTHALGGQHCYALGPLIAEAQRRGLPTSDI